MSLQTPRESANRAQTPGVRTPQPRHRPNARPRLREKGKNAKIKGNKGKGKEKRENKEEFEVKNEKKPTLGPRVTTRPAAR